MNQCAMQQANAFAACEEIGAAFAVAERRTPVFCPKPRRFSTFAAVADPERPLRWHSSHQMDLSDSKAGADLLEIFQSKGGEQNQIASSPPFFCGSPPIRAANPVVHDARFGDDRLPAPFASSPLTQPSPSMPPKHDGFALAKFGLVPAAVRVEGFDCLNRSRPSCSSITAVA